MSNPQSPFPLPGLCSIALHKNDARTTLKKVHHARFRPVGGGTSLGRLGRLPRMSGVMTLRRLLPALLCLCLPGCAADSYRLFHPVGPVAFAEWRFTLLDVGVMLLIILPVTVMIAVFIWRYRKGRDATYDPTWSHSLGLELVMWGVPFIIVIFLGYNSYESTMLVNPYGPGALNLTNPADAPLQVDVITTDWQWFFVYPQQHIATIDDLVVPAGRPIRLRLTSTSVTNDFYIPEVAPMIDVMPGMRTMDAFQVNHASNYEGFSADFSGAGFSWMQFSTRIMAPADFNKWVVRTQTAPNQLSYPQFTRLAVPTVNVGAKPAYFSHVADGLFDSVYTAAQRGVVYPVPADVEIPVASNDYTQGKNGTN
jgi:cytochrome o ubiquinol oxidase subunit 2